MKSMLETPVHMVEHLHHYVVHSGVSSTQCNYKDTLNTTSIIMLVHVVVTKYSMYVQEYHTNTTSIFM